MAKRTQWGRRPLLSALVLVVAACMVGMIVLDRIGGPATTMLFSVDEGTDLDKVFEKTLHQARHQLQVERNGFELHSATSHALEHTAAPASSTSHVAKQVDEGRLVHAAADLEKAAALEAAAGGVGSGVPTGGAQQEEQEEEQQPSAVQAPPPALQTVHEAAPQRQAAPVEVVRVREDPEISELVSKAKTLLSEAEQGRKSLSEKKEHYVHHGPMTGRDSRLALQDFFDANEKKIEAGLPSTKEKATKLSKEEKWSSQAKDTMKEEAAEIERLQQQVEAYAAQSASAAQAQAAGGTLKKALFGNGGLKAAADSLARELMPSLHSRSAALRAPSAQTAYANIYQAAAPEEQTRSLGVPMPTRVEAHRLPGVNVADWMDPRVTRQMETAEWRSAHPAANAGAGSAYVAGYMDPDEGGSQLASFALPPPPKAAPAPPPAPAKAPASCPPCGFLDDCQLNPEARGKSRATGAYTFFPPRHHALAWGGGGSHPSTLASAQATSLHTMGGVSQSKPLWGKLAHAISSAVSSSSSAAAAAAAASTASTASSSKTRKLLAARGAGDAEEDAEGGATQELASFALPPPPKAAPAPPPKCVCPLHCKLGDERVGFEDEHHGKMQLADPDLLQAVDEELMRLDPHYAQERLEPGALEKEVTRNARLLWPSGRANPLSDFTDEDQRPYTNQVIKKNTVVW